MKSKGKKIGVALLVIVFLLALPYIYNYIKLNNFIKQQEEILNTKFIPKLKQIEEEKGILNVLKENDAIRKNNYELEEDDDGEYYEANYKKFNSMDYSIAFYYYRGKGARSDLITKKQYIVPSMFVLSKYYNYISKAVINNDSDMEYVLHAWYENRPTEVDKNPTGIETVNSFIIYIIVDEDDWFAIDVNEDFDDYYEDVYKKILELM